MIISEYYMRGRQKELLAEAEKHRLLALSKRETVKANPKNARMLVWVGGLMCRWGSQLEERFAVEVKPSQTNPVDRGLKV